MNITNKTVGVPVIVIRNRDLSRSETYRVRNLLTNEISYTNSVTLLNPVVIPDVDRVPNLEAERVVRCNWAFTGTVALAEDVRKLSNKTAIETDMYGFKIGGDRYYESVNGPLKALQLSEDASRRFVWLKVCKPGE